MAGIEEAAPGDPIGAGFQVGIVEHDAGALAPQLQGHRDQLAGSGGHHPLAGAGAAGEKDVVKGLLQQRFGHGNPPLLHGHHLRLEVLGHSGGDHGRHMGGVLRRFKHRGVARRQGCHQGLQR